jgi:hypothetical protein
MVNALEWRNLTLAPVPHTFIRSFEAFQQIEDYLNCIAVTAHANNLTQANY